MALDPDTLFRIHEAFRWRRGRNQTTALSTYWRDLINRDPNLTTLSVCVDLVIGRDTIVRVSNRPVHTVSSLTGYAYQYLPVLQGAPALVDLYTMCQSSSQSRTFSVSIPNKYVDVATLINRGRLLAGVGEVSLQVDGGDYEERIIWLRGDMADGVTFAAIDELVECSITDPRETTDVSLPPFVIDDLSQATRSPSDNAKGQRYALVPTRYDAVPCWWIDTGSPEEVAVCIGHLDDATNYINVNGTQYANTDLVYGYNWVQDADDFGVPITIVQFTGSAVFSFSEQVYAYPSGGDASTDHPLDAIRLVVERYTSMGTAGASNLLFAAARSKTPTLQARMLVNAGGAANTTSLSYIEEEFLSSFPMISMIWHGTGYGPVVTDRRSSQVVLELNASQFPILDRASSVTETPKGNCFNDFTLQYAYDPIEDNYTKVLSIGARDNNLCAISLDQIGSRPMDVIESPYIFDDATAQYVVGWLTDHLTLPSYLVDYAVSKQLFLLLKPGDNVKITDTEFGWQSVIATVESLRMVDTHVVMTLRVWWRYLTLGTGSATMVGRSS